MLHAVVSDFARLPGVEVRAIRDRGLEPFAIPGVREEPAEPASFKETAGRVLAECDAAFVIAPESDGILADHCRLVEGTDARWLGCSLAAIELCADKLRLAEVLEQAGVATVATTTPREPSAWPVVLKPRFGAGCEDTYLVDNKVEHHRVMAANQAGEFVQQPYIEAPSFSVAAIASPEGSIAFPPVRQRINVSQGTLSYVGGCLNHREIVAIPDEVIANILLATGIENGWVGIDFLCPPDSATMVVVDINPRLTTSYVAYREAADVNLAALLLPGKAHHPGWKPGRYEFNKSGRVSLQPVPSRDPDRPHRP